MPNISRTKTWNANETLTAADLNAEYNGILTGINDNALNNDNLNQTDDYLFGSLITGSGLAAAGGDGKLHVHVASAGSVAAHANGNDFVIEGTANPGMSFLSGASTTNSIYFGDVNDNDAGSIVYTHGADMAFTVETAEVLSLSASTITALAGITVGVDDAGHDVKIFGNAAGAYMEWDASADQLRLVGASADAVGSSGKLLFATSQTDVRANDILGQIEFQAPLEAQDTDAREVAAAIKAVAQGTFAADLNATDLIFYTGHSEAATEKFRMTSQGEIGIGGANYGTDGQVLTSGGAGAAVAWEALPTSSSAFSADVTVANGYGLVVGGTAQQEISDGDGSTAVVPEAQILGTAAADTTLLIGGWSETATRAAAPTLAFLKSGHATIGTHTVVTDNEILGSIIAYGDTGDGQDYRSPAAAIEFAVDGTAAAGDMPGSIEFYTTVDAGETLTSAMKIDNAGVITQARQPCFLTYQTSYQSAATGDGTVATVLFGTEVVDKGGDLSGTTFTAPVTGMYQINANVHCDSIASGHTNGQIRITPSNRNLIGNHNNPYASGNASGEYGYGNSVIADMDAGDTCVIQVYIVGAAKAVRFSSGTVTRFSGCLIA